MISWSFARGGLLFAMAAIAFSMVLSSSSFAQTTPRDVEKKARQCIDTCFAFHEEPGSSLKRCVKKCTKAAIRATAVAASSTPIEVTGSSMCETYENCDDGGSRDTGPDSTDDGTVRETDGSGPDDVYGGI